MSSSRMKNFQFNGLEIFHAARRHSRFRTHSSIQFSRRGAHMRRMQWIAVLAIGSGGGLTACGGDAEEVPATEQPAAAPQPEAAPAPAVPAGPLPDGVTHAMVAA